MLNKTLPDGLRSREGRASADAILAAAAAQEHQFVGHGGRVMIERAYKAQRKALGAMDDCIRRLRFTLDNLIDVTGLETGKMRFFNKDYDFLDTVRRVIALPRRPSMLAAMRPTT